MMATRRSAMSAASATSVPRSFWTALLQWWAAVPLLLLLALLASYWPTLVPLYGDWQSDDNYSVGQLVPLAAMYMLWHDRKRLAKCRPAPCWWGLAVILLAQVARGLGAALLYESLERYSLVLTLAGVILLVGGREVFRQTAWVLLFLFLMVPLPGRLHNAIAGPLQSAATGLAVGALEIMGISVLREGHTMLLNDSVPVAVAEACSGLRMLTAFVVVASVMAYVVRRPRWQRVVMVLSSIPVAIFCNQVRLVTTALLFLTLGSEVGRRFFHDFAGLTMMPLAVLILVGELFVMSRLVVEDEHG